MVFLPLEGLLPGPVSERMQDPEGAAEKSSASLKTESKMFSFCPLGHECRCPEERAWERILKSEWWRPGGALRSVGTALPGGTGGSLNGGRRWSGASQWEAGVGKSPCCPRWKREALATGDRGERGATCQGQGSSEEWRQPPQTHTTPRVHTAAKFSQGMALLERVG